MSVAIVGGLDRLRRSYYEKKCKDMGYQGKVFNRQIPNLANRMTGVSGIVIFTGTVAHPMVEEATPGWRGCGTFPWSAVIPAVFQH